MNNFFNTLRVEWRKSRRSRVPLVTAIGFTLLPLAGGFFMFVLTNPEVARGAGLISAKAQLTIGTADWQTYLDFLAQGIAVGGFLLFGIIGSWIFGREYADRTLKDLLALPTARSSIVLSKFLVVILWAGALTLWVCAIALIVGLLLVLPQFSVSHIAQALGKIWIVCGLTLLLIPPVSFFANVGRGYLPAVGAIFVFTFFAQVITISGYGEFFPWAIPALYARGNELGAVSYMLVFLTGILGTAATFFWWKFADQTR